MIFDVGNDLVLHEGRTGFITVNSSAPSRIEIVDIKSTRGIQFRTLSDATGVVYVGYRDNVDAGIGETTSGFPIEPGEGIHIPQDKANRLYFISDTDGQKVFWAIL